MRNSCQIKQNFDDLLEQQRHVCILAMDGEGAKHDMKDISFSYLPLARIPPMASLKTSFADLKSTPRMPALFVGHGSPMNAIEDNEFSRGWGEMGKSLPVPSAILCVSAHWMTRGTTLVNVKDKPQTIHDFGGFPRALYQQQYPAPGAPGRECRCGFPEYPCRS